MVWEVAYVVEHVDVFDQGRFGLFVKRSWTHGCRFRRIRGRRDDGVCVWSICRCVEDKGGMLRLADAFAVVRGR